MQKKKGFGLQWHITDKCDQRCKHCYIYAGKDKEQKAADLPIYTLNKILIDYLETCEKMNVTPAVSVTGGDPLLYDDSNTFFKLLKLYNVPFSVLGNPFHLNYKTAYFLKDCGCANYQMSLDGLEKTHDSIRKPGSFKTTLGRIGVLNDAGIQSTIMTTVSKLNVLEIPELIDIIVKNKVQNFAFARYCPNQGDIESMATSKQYKDMMEKVWDRFIKYKDRGTRFALKDHLWYPFLTEKGVININETENPENLILDGCHCGISHLTVLADGSVYACRRFESKVGEVPRESLYDIFNGDKMDQYRKYDEFKKCSKCELLNFCRGCPAVAYCTTGDFYGEDPQCWKEL